AEFAIPAVEGDENDGRCTVMGAGGTVQANIDRWVGQFTETNRNKTEKKEIAGQTVHVVDLGGTYKDQRGPFAPAQLRENYRVLGATACWARSSRPRSGDSISSSSTGPRPRWPPTKKRSWKC
nr:hypothetical protein [Pirellulaceae bacterium]